MQKYMEETPRPPAATGTKDVTTHLAAWLDGVVTVPLEVGSGLVSCALWS